MDPGFQGGWKNETKPAWIRNSTLFSTVFYGSYQKIEMHKDCKIPKFATGMGGYPAKAAALDNSAQSWGLKQITFC